MYKMHKHQQVHIADTIGQSMSIFEKKELKIRYKFLTYYLQYLYKTHVNLELEIMISLFYNKESEYNQFITGKLQIEGVESACNKISLFLKSHDYSFNLIDYPE